MKTNHNKKPILALFDDLNHIDKTRISTITNKKEKQDHMHAVAFLKSYRGSQGTFNSYRREIERLLQWTWLVAEKTIKELNREDIEAFIAFCQKPPNSWISLQKFPRFVVANGERKQNPKWKPFTATVSKAARLKGEKPDKKNFKLSSGSIKETFAILSSFYNYLLQEEYTHTNPVTLIRQKGKFIRKHQEPPKIRRLSEKQWQHVLKAAKVMAENNPILHERTLFIITALYAMYLRISELTASIRWIPMMNHFFRDNNENWWFTTVGKGNKQRQIAVSNEMLKALKRWRKHLNLSSLPSPADNYPLLPKLKGKGAISDTTYVRELVQDCFDKARYQLDKNNFIDESESLAEATVHWLRHTGISDDVKIRPREHVRDDAGHSSSATTDKYIDIELKERHATAKNKPID